MYHHHLIKLFAVSALVFSTTTHAGQHDFAVAAAVHGNVFDSAGNPVTSGQSLRPGNGVNTAAASGLQLLFTDGSVVTLGETTTALITDYQYDPASDAGQLAISVPNGTYKMVTGRIAEAQPRKVSIDIPKGRVELLGTVVSGESDPEGESTVVLVGPGAQRLSADKKGSFAFIPKGAAVQTGENEITVFKSGYAVTVDPDGNVSEPFEMSGRDFGQMVAALARQKGGNDDSDDDIGDDDGALEGDDDGDGENGELLAMDDDASGGDAVEGGTQDEDEVDVGDDDEMDDDGVDGSLAALREAQDVTQLVDLEDIAGLKGRYVESGIEMDNGGTFDYRFEFGAVESAKLDFVGFENVQTGDVTDGELSWDTAVDGDPTFEELDLSSEDGTLIAKDGCDGVCSGVVTVLNAGQGNAAKFHLIELDTGDDFIEDKLVRKGGNNNFPGSD